jgi:hypothetical protein
MVEAASFTGWTQPSLPDAVFLLLSMQAVNDLPKLNRRHATKCFKNRSLLTRKKKSPPVKEGPSSLVLCFMTLAAVTIPTTASIISSCSLH